MPVTTAVHQLSRDAVDKVLKEAKANPQTYGGKFVGIANGQIVIVTDRMDEVGPRLRQVEPDTAKTFWIEIATDGTQVHHIWRGF